MARFYKEVYVRAHDATPPSTYAGLASGWTKYDNLLEKNKMELSPKAQNALADGTSSTDSEETVTDFTADKVSGVDYNNMRSLMINQKVDVLFVDPDQLTLCPYLENVRLYPKITAESGATLKVAVSGAKEASVNAPAQSFVSLS